MCVCKTSCCFFVFKQKTAYEMRISDWGSDVFSSDLQPSPDRDDNPPAADSPRPRSPAGVAGPTGEAASVAVGLIPDEPGAVAAGLAYATASQHWLYFTDEEIEDAISEIATSVAAPRLTEDVVADISIAQIGRASCRERVCQYV